MRTHALHAAAAVFLLLVTARADAQLTFRDPALRFSVDIPAGWTQVGPAELDAFQTTPPAGGTTTSLAGYIRTSPGAAKSSGPMRPPCIIIERRTLAFHLSGLSYDKLSSKLGLARYEDLEKNGQFDSRGRYRGDNMSPPTLVRGNDLILVQGVTTGADGQGVYLFSVGYLGKHDIVRVSAFVPTDSADSMMSQFENMMHSGGFDPGAEFQETVTRSRTYRRGGPLGGATAAIAALFFLFRRWAND